MSLLLVLNACELIAFITGLLVMRKLSHSYWRLFPVYIGIILLTELTAEYLAQALNKPVINKAIYIYFGIPFEFLFLFWLFWQYFYSTRVRKWPVIATILYLLTLFIDLVYISHIKEKMFFASFSYLIGNIMLLVLLFLFLLRFSRNDEILRYRSSMMFWVSIGLLMFYLGSLPFYGLKNTLYYEQRTLFYAYRNVQAVLDCLMYCFFVLAFLWGKPERRYEA